jgi:hypothetical protein
MSYHAPPLSVSASGSGPTTVALSLLLHDVSIVIVPQIRMAASIHNKEFIFIFISVRFALQSYTLLSKYSIDVHIINILKGLRFQLFCRFMEFFTPPKDEEKPDGGQLEIEFIYN